MAQALLKPGLKSSVIPPCEFTTQEHKFKRWFCNQKQKMHLIGKQIDLSDMEVCISLLYYKTIYINRNGVAYIHNYIKEIFNSLVF